MQEMNKSNSKPIQELKNATVGNSRDIQGIHQAIAKIEGQISQLVVELNRIEEEELQSQLMTEMHYLVDEDEVVDNEEEQIEHHEKSEPLTDPKMSSDMEMSIEAHACITIPIKTHQELKASSIECLKEPSY
jgi:hypothetical protein